MERRELLFACAALAAAPAACLAGTLAEPACRFRWDRRGRVFFHDGHRWSDSIRLAEHTRILSVEESGTRAILSASHRGQSFQLCTRDGATWRPVKVHDHC